MKLTTNFPVGIASSLGGIRNAQATILDSTEKLTTGKEIGRAADNVAYIGKATRLESQIRSTSAAIGNMSEALSLFETAEIALAEAEDMLNRIRELALQASSDAINTEMLKKLENF